MGSDGCRPKYALFGDGQAVSVRNIRSSCFAASLNFDSQHAAKALTAEPDEAQMFFLHVHATLS